MKAPKPKPSWAHRLNLDTLICECGIKTKHNRCMACNHKDHEECHGPKCCCECPCKGKKKGKS